MFLGAGMELRLERGEQVAALVEKLTERGWRCCGCWADTGRGFHPGSPPSGGCAPPPTPPS